MKLPNKEGNVVVGFLNICIKVAERGEKDTIPVELRRAAQCCDFSATGTCMLDLEGEKLLFRNSAFLKLHGKAKHATRKVAEE